MKISVWQLHQASTLATAAAGQAVLGEVLKKIGEEWPGSGFLFLDFSGVNVATGSFLRSLIIPLRDHCRRTLGISFAVANPNELVQEELQALLDTIRDAVVICQLDSRNTPVLPRVAGYLDATQRLTLEAVERTVEADAPRLAELYSSTDPIGPTGWNNRLAVRGGLKNTGPFCRG
jgi:hypothetical protein